LELAADSTDASHRAIRLNRQAAQCSARLAAEAWSILLDYGEGGFFEERRIALRSLGAVGERKHRRSSGRGGCGPPLRIILLPRAFVRSSRGVPRLLAFGLLFQPHDKLIGDFPTKMSRLTALHQTLLQENGAPRIGHEYPGSGQKNVAGAVMHLDTAPEQNGIAGHTQSVSEPVKIRSIVRKDSP